MAMLANAGTVEMNCIIRDKYSTFGVPYHLSSIQLFASMEAELASTLSVHVLEIFTQTPTPFEPPDLLDSKAFDCK